MKNKLTFFLLFFLLCSFQLLKAQQLLVKGIVPKQKKDSVAVLADSAAVRSLNPQDSSIIKKADILLSEVVITAEIPGLVVKGDTLEYNPRAFQMTEISVVEDLLRRLPGVEVQADGKITVVGKEIKRVFVDGKEFFGQSPKMATKNLTVNMIDKVQVFEKKSDQKILTGIEDGEEETIINLTIKPGMKKGWISNMALGAGSFIDNPQKEDARYSGDILISRFQDDNQYAWIANLNNVNNQSFADDENKGKSNGNGITSSANTGLNVVGIMNDKWKTGGNVRENYSEELIKQHSFRQNLLKDSVSYRESLLDEQTYSNDFAFDHKIEFTPNSLNTFALTTGVIYENSRSKNYSNQNTYAGDEDSTQINHSDAQTKFHSTGLLLNAELAYSRKFSKRGHRFNLIGKFGMKHYSDKGFHLSTNEFYMSPLMNQYLNQESTNISDNNFYSFTVSYIEPVKKSNTTLQFSYNIRYNFTENIRETYDYEMSTNKYSALNPEYSKSLRNHFVTQTMGVSYNVIQPKYTYNIGMNIIPSYTQSAGYIKNGNSLGNDSILNKITGHSVVNYSPQLSFAYRFSNRSNLNFIYRGNSNQPSVAQLDPTPNNYNPLTIYTGNPNLLPSFLHNLSLRYNWNELQTQRSLIGFLYFSFVQNEIINTTSYEEKTAIQYIVPANENGSWNTSGNILYNIPLSTKKRLRLNIQTKLNYNNRIGFIRLSQQSERNISKTFGIIENIGLIYNNDWFYGQFRGNIQYSNTSNTLKGRTKQKNTYYEFAYDTQLYLPHNWTLISDVNYRITRGLTMGYNNEEIAWNIEVSKQLLKKKNVTLRIKWFDILQQKLNINRNITSQYIEDTEYNTLSGYFLVSFVLRLNQLGNKK